MGDGKPKFWDSHPLLRVLFRAALYLGSVLGFISLLSPFWEPAKMAEDYAFADPLVVPLAYAIVFMVTLLQEALNEKQRIELERRRSEPETRTRPPLLGKRKRRRERGRQKPSRKR